VGAEFVWRMEDVLDLYAQPYDQQQPVVCIDERPCQLLEHKHPPISAQPGQPQRVDYQYQRNGHCNLFIAFQPLQGWRHVEVTQRRTSNDFALWLKQLVDQDFKDASKIRLVLDNLNIHTPASLYKTFQPAEAQRILQKLEFHYTPKHGSWLNMVEIELSVLARQCLARRIPDIDILKQEIEAWQKHRNKQRATVEWRFSCSDARTKLKRLYPLI
jgi:hypothetical protein